MSITAISNFFTVLDGTSVAFAFQNSKPNDTITYNGTSYQYLSFIYQGAAKTRSGDNMVSTLALSTNPLSMTYADEAVQKRWNIRMDTCSMNPKTWTVARTLTTEYWIAASMRYDTTSVEIALSSSIDAVGVEIPTRVLSPALVGLLPTTGNVQAL